MRIRLGLIGLSLIGFFGFASASQAAISDSRILHLRFHQVTVYQDTSGYVFSGGVSWNPILLSFFKDNFTLRANLSSALLRSNDGDVFPANEYMLMFSFLSPKQIHFELGGGLTHWIIGAKEPDLGFAANVLIPSKTSMLGFLDYWVAGYAPTLFKVGIGHQIKLGMGF